MTESSSVAPGPGRATAPGWPAAPALPSLFASWWPRPAPPPSWLPFAAVGAGAVGALLLPAAPRVGGNLAITVLAAVAPVALLAGRRTDVGARVLGGLAVALTVVAAVRASEWLGWFCALAGLCLGVAVAVDARRWHALVGAFPAFGVALARAIPWIAGGAIRPAGGLRRALPWVTGSGIGLVAATAVGALLASGDQAFAGLLDTVLPSWQLELYRFPERVVWFVLVTSAVLAGAFAAAARLDWDRSAPPPRTRVRPVAEWLLPVLLVAAVIAVFLVVQAVPLFGGDEVLRRLAGVNHAERAREGFAQLSVVTLIVLALLAWAGRVVAPGPATHQRVFGAAGGVLAAMALVLAASALRRMWLYQAEYGWTVLRIVVSVFELWVAAVIVGAGVAWLARRTAILPRAVAGSAAAVLFALGLAGPDGIAARWNVDRFERTGSIDVDYLRMLSPDAVPALQRLPEPYRSCALQYQEVQPDPWFAPNLARARANASLRERPALPVTPAQDVVCVTDRTAGR